MFSVSKFLKQQFYFIKKAKAGNFVQELISKSVTREKWECKLEKNKIIQQKAIEKKICWDMILRILRTKMMVNYIFNTEHISKSRLDKKDIYNE